MKALGIDVGSLTTKAVVFNGNGTFISSIIPSGDDAEKSARSAIESVQTQAGLTEEKDWFIVATGAGSKSLTFTQQQKSITTCVARGTNLILPTARMVIDIGAESGAVLKVNERGRLNDWASHDKCAAGTGIFLQQMAKLMQISIEEMARLSILAKARADITGTCAVFAESEVISHVHRQPPTPKEVIIAGIYYSVVTRIIGLCKRVNIEKEVAITGGVALNQGVVHMLEEELGFPILVPQAPQVIGALGAALIARENIEKGAAK
jgi:predicted CoA-substrate-specific enzyme activase